MKKPDCFEFTDDNTTVRSTNGTLLDADANARLMTFVHEIKNVINDQSIPRKLRNKLMGDMESDAGLEINPQKIFEFALGNRYGVASERILNAFKDSVKKNDVFEQVKIDNIFKDDLKNQEAFVKGKLRKTIKSNIRFEEKLNEEVPKGKNYIIKNVKGRDEIVVKHLDGQNNDTLTTSILSDYFADVGFKKIVGDDRYLGLVRNIIDSKDIEIKAIVDKHKKTGKKSSELFNSAIKDLLEDDKTLSLGTYENVRGALNNTIRNFIPKSGRPFSMSELKNILGTSLNIYKGNPDAGLLNSKLKNIFGGDSVKGSKVNLYMNKGLKEIYDKQMYNILSNMTNFLKFESIRAEEGSTLRVNIPDFVTRINRLLYTARVSGVDFGLDVKTLSGKNIITEIDKFLNNTLRPKFFWQVKKILKGEKLSDEELLKMKDFIQESTEYKALSDVGKEYQPYIRSINRNKFDYEGIESIDEMKAYEHHYKSLSGRLANGFFKGLNKIDNKLYSDEKLSEHLISSYNKGTISEDFAKELFNIKLATSIPRSHRFGNSRIGTNLEVEFKHLEEAPSVAITKIENVYFSLTKTEPLIGSYMKAISDSYDALFFFKKESNEMNVGTFKNLVLEYAMIRGSNRGSKFPVRPKIWLTDKLKGMDNISDNNVDSLLVAIKEADNAIMDFNTTMSGKRDPTYLGLIFDTTKAQQQKPELQNIYKKSFLEASGEFDAEQIIAEFERKGIDESYYNKLGIDDTVKRWKFARKQKPDLDLQKQFLSEFRALASTDVTSMFDHTSTAKLNADIEGAFLARAKGVVQEGDTIINGVKVISKEAKKAYASFLKAKVREGADEEKLREASSFAKKRTPLTPWELKDFVVRDIDEYLNTYANRRAYISSHQKAYGSIPVIRGKPKVDEEGNIIQNEQTGNIEYEGDLYLNSYFERRRKKYKDNPDALKGLDILDDIHKQVVGTYGKGEKNFLNSSMKRISQVLIMSLLGKNYQWAVVEGLSGMAGLGQGGIVNGIKLYRKIRQNPILAKEFDSIINKRKFHSSKSMLISKQYGDHVVDLFDKDTLSTITKNSQVLNGNAAISDNFRVMHAYLAKSDLDRLIIENDSNLLRIFNSMGISINHIKELKTMLKDAPMIKEEGVFGFEPSYIKSNSKLLNLYSKVLNTYLDNYSIHKNSSSVPDFQQTNIGGFLLLFRSFEQSLYSSIQRSVRAGDSRAINRIAMQIAGTLFLQSYRAGKYYNFDRDGDKIAIDFILNSGIIGTTGIVMDLMYQGIANNRISLAPLSVTQGVIQEGKIKPLVPFSSNPVVEMISQGL